MLYKSEHLREKVGILLVFLLLHIEFFFCETSFVGYLINRFGLSIYYLIPIGTFFSYKLMFLSYIISIIMVFVFKIIGLQSINLTGSSINMLLISFNNQFFNYLFYVIELGILSYMLLFLYTLFYFNYDMVQIQSAIKNIFTEGKVVEKKSNDLIDVYEISIQKSYIFNYKQYEELLTKELGFPIKFIFENGKFFIEKSKRNSKFIYTRKDILVSQPDTYAFFNSFHQPFLIDINNNLLILEKNNESIGNILHLLNLTKLNAEFMLITAKNEILKRYKEENHEFPMYLLHSVEKIIEKRAYDIRKEARNLQEYQNKLDYKFLIVFLEILNRNDDNINLFYLKLLIQKGLKVGVYFVISTDSQDIFNYLKTVIDIRIFDNVDYLAHPQERILQKNFLEKSIIIVQS